MAKKDSTVYFCNECGYESSKWMGQCPACKAWNTFVEEKVDKKILSSSAKRNEAGSKHASLSQISTEEEESEIIDIEELDRVLGGGIVSGSLTLVGGDPGIGKSTLLLQVCKMLSDKGKEVL